MTLRRSNGGGGGGGGGSGGTSGTVYSTPMQASGAIPYAHQALQGYDSTNGALALTFANPYSVGDSVTLYDVGGNVQANNVTVSDTRGYQIQDPQSGGLSLLASYVIRTSGSITWTLTTNTRTSTTYWAVTGTA